METVVFFVLGSREMTFVFTTCAMRYGPVAGRGSRAWRGVFAGTASAAGSASFSRKSGSGAARWKVTVLAIGSVKIPLRKSHCLGLLTQRPAPTIPAK